MRLLVFFAFLALQGCVGVEFIHDKTTHVESPTGTYYLTARAQSDQYGDAPFTDVHLGGWPARTKDDLRKHWGEPDAIWFDGETEKWRYNKNVSWAVFMPELIIPIPLGIPTGHSAVIFTFHGSNIVSVDVDRMRRTGLGCGYYVLGVGCIAGGNLHGVVFIGAGA